MWRDELHRGVVLENPVVVSALGFTPLLAMSSSMKMALTLALCLTLILALSNGIVSMCRNIIPERLKMLFLFCCSAFAATIVQIVLTDVAPAQASALGIYLPLCAVSSMVYVRMNRYALRNGVWSSIRDGLVIGLGFAMVLLGITVIREIIGSNTFFGYGLIPGLQPIRFFEYAPGGFIVLGLLLALCSRPRRKRDQKP